MAGMRRSRDASRNSRLTQRTEDPMPPSLFFCLRHAAPGAAGHPDPGMERAATESMAARRERNFPQFAVTFTEAV